MGALTLNIPFSYRSWETEVFSSFDPTNGFAVNTKIFLKNNCVTSIEPEKKEENNWLTNKGRLFFDTIYKKKDKNKNVASKKILEEESEHLNFFNWNFLNLNKNNKKSFDKNVFSNYFLSKTNSYLYLISLFNLKESKKKLQKKFTIVFEAVSLETIAVLALIENSFPFVSIKRILNTQTINNDLESSFQLNVSKVNNKLNYANVALLLSIDSSSEGNILDVYLRQRSLKGNFNCYSIGAIVNHNLPVTFLGSNLSLIKTITEGNHALCQKIKKSVLTFYNTNLTNRKDSVYINESIKFLKNANEIFKNFTDINFFLFSIFETGMHVVGNKFKTILKSDLEANLNLIYFLNSYSESRNLKKILLNTELYFEKYENKFLLTNTVLEHASKKSFFQNVVSFNENFLKKFVFKNFFKKFIFTEKHINKTLYFFYPTQHFFSSNLTLVNVEGLIKRTNKITKENLTFKHNDLSFIINFFKKIKQKTQFFFCNENLTIFDFQNALSLKHFLQFFCQATHVFKALNFFLTFKNNTFVTIIKKIKPFFIKRFNTKLKFWINDFFSTFHDNYSSNSFILTNYAENFKLNQTNFF